MQRLSVELLAIPPDGASRVFKSSGKALGLVDAELTVVQPVEILCQFFKVDHEVVVRGALCSAIRLSCSRCAEDFVQPLNLALDAMYLPTLEMVSKRAHELEEGDSDVYAYAEEEVDLAEMIRDKLLLSIPQQPYCAVGCKGLCPACGVNRNAVGCQCAEEKLGSPFELLKGLRFSSQRSEE